MRVLTSPESFQFPSELPLLLGLGNFDGVHRGHQLILRTLIRDAKKYGGQAGLITFQTHPQALLNPSKKPALLCSPEHKLLLLEETGLDLCFFLPFTASFAEIEPEAFIQNILVNQLRVKKMILGHNARFGRQRKGDAKFMAQSASRMGFSYEEVSGFKVDDELVSSSRIRGLILKGELALAETCLGRPYSILAEIIHGDGRGSSLGFPTANLKIDLEIIPPEGVYAVQVREVSVLGEMPERLENPVFRTGPWRPGVLNYGKRPTFHQEKGAPKVAEVFILDSVTDSLYGKHFEVAFRGRIRGEQVFPSSEALKTQIALDVAKAQEVLGAL